MEHHFLFSHLFSHSVLIWFAGYLLAGVIFNCCLFGPAWKTRSSAPRKEVKAAVTLVARPIRKKCLHLSGQERMALGIRKRLARQAC